MRKETWSYTFGGRKWKERNNRSRREVTERKVSSDGEIKKEWSEGDR